jgi:hypothetical protein
MNTIIDIVIILNACPTNNFNFEIRIIIEIEQFNVLLAEVVSRRILLANNNCDLNTENKLRIHF